MKTFDLPAAVRLKLLKTTPNKEHHGDALVQAISLRLAWETTNESLALLHPQLKDMLFWRPPQMDAQQTVEGVPETTPFLRVPTVALPLKIEAQFTGYTFTIEHGIDDSSALELYLCTLSKFAVDAKEGGTSTIMWSLGSNKEITPELVGELCGLEGGEIVAWLKPPTVDAGPAIDGSVEAFKKDHPEFADGADSNAGDLFAEQHGGEKPAGDTGQADDDSAGPGTGSSDDAPFGEPQTGENWPFPQGDNADTASADAGGDAAEFEAGAAAAIAKAGVAPRGRRGRKTAGVVE